MFARRVKVEFTREGRETQACPVSWIDNFAMRNFTNDPIFDDTLPVADGLIEIGNRVPIERLHAAMDDWFRRKGYLKSGDTLQLS
jgi:hypothetical protein